MLPSLAKMTENMTKEDFMSIMRSFKDTIEKSVVSMGDIINTKIEERMTNLDEKIAVQSTNLDKGLKDLNKKLEKSEDKQDAINKRFEDRINRMEQDAKRAKHGRMKSDTLQEKTT